MATQEAIPTQYDIAVTKPVKYLNRLKRESVDAEISGPMSLNGLKELRLRLPDILGSEAVLNDIVNRATKDVLPPDEALYLFINEPTSQSTKLVAGNVQNGAFIPQRYCNTFDHQAEGAALIEGAHTPLPLALNGFPNTKDATAFLENESSGLLAKAILREKEKARKQSISITHTEPGKDEWTDSVMAPRFIAELAQTSKLEPRHIANLESYQKNTAANEPLSVVQIDTTTLPDSDGKQATSTRLLLGKVKSGSAESGYVMSYDTVYNPVSKAFTVLDTPIVIGLNGTKSDDFAFAPKDGDTGLKQALKTLQDQKIAQVSPLSNPEFDRILAAASGTAFVGSTIPTKPANIDASPVIA